MKYLLKVCEENVETKVNRRTLNFLNRTCLTRNNINDESEWLYCNT